VLAARPPPNGAVARGADAGTDDDDDDDDGTEGAGNPRAGVV